MPETLQDKIWKKMQEKANFWDAHRSHDGCFSKVRYCFNKDGEVVDDESKWDGKFSAVLEVKSHVVNIYEGRYSIRGGIIASKGPFVK